MLKHLFSTGLLLMVLSAGSAVAVSIPDFKATYKLSRGSMKIGTSTLELATTADGEYRYESHSWPVSWVSWFIRDRLDETSRGRIEDSRVRPLFYHYQRSGGSREREARLTFDWDRGIVSNNVEDSRWNMEIPEGTLDKLASQLGMMYALQAGQSDIVFSIADGGKLKEYRFRIVDRETITLPAGAFDTVKLTKVRNNRKRETYIWCAPELSYLPVRIWQREKDGSEYQSDLLEVTGPMSAASTR